MTVTETRILDGGATQAPQIARLALIVAALRRGATLAMEIVPTISTEHKCAVLTVPEHGPDKPAAKYVVLRDDVLALELAGIITFKTIN